MSYKIKNVNKIQKGGNQELINAVKENSLSKVENLLKFNKSINLDLVDDDGNTALDLAIMSNNLEIVRLLINSMPKNGKLLPDNTLFKISKTTDIRIFRLILSYNKDIDAKNIDTQFLKYRIERPTELRTPEKMTYNAGVTNSGSTLLIESIINNNVEQFEYLIGQKANVNIQMDELVYYNPNDSRDKIMVYAQRWGVMRYGIIETAMEVHKIGNTALIEAVKRQQDSMVEQLIKANADVERINRYGNTALIEAVKTKNVVIVNHLLNAGADVNIKNDDGNSALLTLVSLPEEDDKTIAIFNMLLNAPNINLNQTHNDGNSAILLALNKGHMHIVDKLLSLHVNINVANSSYKTPLKTAIQQKNLPLAIKMIEENNADVNLKTPLYEAVMIGDENLVNLLLNKGALINQKLHIGHVLDLAIEGDNLSMVNFLLSRGANINHDTYLMRDNGRGDDVVGGRTLMKAATVGPHMIGCLVHNGYSSLYHGVNAIFRILAEAEFNSIMSAAPYYNQIRNLMKDNILKEILKERNSTPFDEIFRRLRFHRITNNNKGQSLKIFKFLIDELKFDVNLAGNTGLTPLMMAAILNDIDLVKYLVDHKNMDSFNSQDNNGNTALMIAVCRSEARSKDVVDLLLMSGVNINLVNKNNNTALMMSKLLSSDYIINRLRILKAKQTNFNPVLIDVDRL